MKNAFSALELLIILVVLCFCCFIFLNKTTNPVTSVVEERKELKSKQELINSQIDNIQQIRETQDKQLEEAME